VTGESAFIEIAHDASLEAAGRDVVRRCPLKGPFKMDFKRDPRDGRWYLLEINARYNLWHYLGAANGLNLPLTAYEYLVHGKRPAAPRGYRTKHRWLYLRFDWLAYRELAARGELTFHGWLASLASAPRVCQLFRWDDPLPFLFRLRHFGSRLPQLTTAMRRWLSTAS